MILASEILEAVKAAGSDNWRPQCELNVKSKATTKHPKLETELIALYEALGNDQLSCTQWAGRMGWKPDIVRCRAEILIRQKKIKRTTGLMPFLYFKA